MHSSWDGWLHLLLINTPQLCCIHDIKLWAYCLIKSHLDLNCVAGPLSNIPVPWCSLLNEKMLKLNFNTYIGSFTGLVQRFSFQNFFS